MDVEQFSEESVAALQDAADRLAAALVSYASTTAAMSGRSSEIPAIHELNDEIGRLATEFNDRVWDHTGTIALLIDRGEEWNGEDDDEYPPLPETVEYVSAVSRWDVAVLDADALLAAGREAQRQRCPQDTPEDAAIAVPNVGRALQAILEVQGEPWYQMPGIAVTRGVRVLIAPSEPPEPYDGDPYGVRNAIAPPEGPVIYTESWA